MKIMRCYFYLLLIILGAFTLAQADTGIDGTAVTVSSLTISGPVYLSTLTATNISVTTITAGNGSVSNPAYSYTASKNSGHYFITNEVDLAVAGTQVSRWTSAGEVAQPLQPSFLVTNSAGADNITGDGPFYTVPWGNEVYDQGGDFSSSTFTAPVSGRYLFTASIMMDNILTTHTNQLLMIVTSNRSYRQEYNQTTATQYLSKSFHTAVIADMDAGDTAVVQIYVGGGTQTVDLHNSAETNFFSGSLIN